MSTFITNNKYLCNTISRITCAIALFLDEVQVVANLREKIYDKQGLTSLLLYTCIGEKFNGIEAQYFYFKCTFCNCEDFSIYTSAHKSLPHLFVVTSGLTY